MTKNWRKVLIILCGFVSIGALGGSVLGLITPDGALIQGQTIITTLQQVPFFGDFIDSLILPAIALFIFVFVPQTIAFVLLLRKHPRQYSASLVCGIMLAVFTLVEIVVMPNPLSWLYLGLSILEVVGVFFASNKKKDER